MIFNKSTNQNDLRVYVNQNIVYQYSDNEPAVSDNKLRLLEKINNYCHTNKILTIAIITMFLLFCILPPFLVKISLEIIANIIIYLIFFGWIFAIIYKIYFKLFKKIKIEYIFDDCGKEYLREFENLLKAFCSSSKIWHLKTKSMVDKRMKSAVKYNVDLELIKVGRSSAPFISSKLKPFSFKTKMFKLYLYPDALFIIAKKNISILDYDDLYIEADLEKLQILHVPKDATIAGYNWLRQNKNGSADLRYKDNVRIPVIYVSRIYVKAKSTNNELIIYLSDINKAKTFMDLLKEMIKEKKEV